MNFIKRMYFKFKEIILYLFFGGLTTIVNIVAFAVLHNVCGINWAVSNVVAWIISVLLAYITNRIFIFESHNSNILKEIFLFFFFRLLSLGLDMLFMSIFIHTLGWEELISKVIVQFLVVSLNYIFSKLIVFSK